MNIENRDRFFQLNKERLEHMAFNAIEKGMGRNSFIAVAIQVDDPNWTDLVDVLMPNYDWQTIRNRGEMPVARGTVNADGLISYLSEVCPDIALDLTTELTPRSVRAVVMADSGASVYHIEPIPHHTN